MSNPVEDVSDTDILVDNNNNSKPSTTTISEKPTSAPSKNDNDRALLPTNVAPPQEQQTQKETSKPEEATATTTIAVEPKQEETSDEAERKEQKKLALNIELQNLVKEDELVKEFLEELRSVRIGTCCTLSPRFFFALTLFLFFLPSLWGVSSVLIDQSLPPRVFYDRCRNSSGNAAEILLRGEISVEFPYEECVACAGNIPYVFTNSSSVTRESQVGFAIVVVVANVIVTFIATIFFARLSLREFTSLKMLCYDVLVHTKLDAWTVGVLILTVILCLIAASLNVAYTYYLQLSMGNIPLGYKRFENETFNFCFGGNQTSNLFAVFDKDNPSLQANNIVSNNPISIIAAVLSKCLLYVPLILKLTQLVFSVYNSFKIEDLFQNSRITAKIFKELAYSVDFDDLHKAIDDYAETQDPIDCSCAKLSFACCLVRATALILRAHFSDFLGVIDLKISTLSCPCYWREIN
jgi:hypothetical protein